MTDNGQVVAWFTFFGLVILARLLTTRPAVRLLGPWVRRLADWGYARMNAPEDVDPETEELAIVRRRQRLEAHLERVRHIMATDEAMPATRQVGNRMAYAWLLDELARTPEVFPVLTSSYSPSLVSYNPRRGSSVEILDIGWRS